MDQMINLYYKAMMILRDWMNKERMHRDKNRRLLREDSKNMIGSRSNSEKI